jgi:HEAT repeat protein
MKRALLAVVGAALFFNPGVGAEWPQPGPGAELTRVGRKIEQGDPATAKELIRSLDGVGADVTSLAGSLGRALKGLDPQARKEAALRIADLGSAGAGIARPDLLRALKDPAPEVRIAVLKALSALPLDHPDLLCVLPCLHDKDANVRTHAAIAVGRFGPGCKDAVPILTELLADEDVPSPKTAPDLTVAYYAVRSLGGIGPTAAAGLPRLLELTEDKSRWMRWAAFEAVSKIGPTDPRVRKLLHSSLGGEGEPRLLAIGALPNLAREDAREYYPDLLKLLKVRDQPRVAGDTAYVLWKVGEGKEVIDGLIGLAKDQTASEEARGSAVGALVRMAPESKAAIPAVAAVLDEKGARGPASEMEEALLAFGADAVPDLIGLLKSDHPWTRRHACNVLGRLGAAASKALPALDALAANEQHAAAKLAATRAAGRIRAGLAGANN